MEKQQIRISFILPFYGVERYIGKCLESIYTQDIPGFSNDTDREENAFPCIIPNWDHTPRSGKRGMVFYGSTPELFRQHVHETLERIIHSLSTNV